MTCTDVIKDADGQIVELRCTYDPETKGGYSPDGRKVRGTLHWVAAADAVEAEVRLYDHLFAAQEPGSDDEIMDGLNPVSLETVGAALLEPSLLDMPVGVPVQFERLGYFCRDRDSTDQKAVFNRTVGLRDSWAKIQKKG